MVFHASAVTPSLGTKDSSGLMGAADGPSSDPTNPDDPPRPEPYSPPVMRSDSWLRGGGGQATCQSHMCKGQHGVVSNVSGMILMGRYGPDAHASYS